MPELPEVERARKLIAETCTGFVVDEVETMEDTIVYAGVDHEEFGKEIKGRTVTGCERKGKQFWITLSGDGRYPVMHFGMTGMVQLRGQEPTWYRRKIHLGETADSWPPKFCKFIMTLSSPGEEKRELAFIDPRRLARLRLLPDPVLSHPPLSELGFDPVLDHPTFEEFKALIGKKKGTVKGVIMDQSFSAGVGNWVADEVLYQARIHPMCPVPALTEAELIDLHRQLREVPLTAVKVNADSHQFPEDWLFRWRWGKGKKKPRGRKKATAEDDEAVVDIKPALEYLSLPDGGKATITFVTVGGRTSAIVSELQKMPDGVEIKVQTKRGGKKKKADSDESELSEPEEKPRPTRAKRARPVKKAKYTEPDSSELSEPSDEEELVKVEIKEPKRGRVAKVKVEVEPVAKRSRKR